MRECLLKCFDLAECCGTFRIAQHVLEPHNADARAIKFALANYVLENACPAEGFGRTNVADPILLITPPADPTLLPYCCDRLTFQRKNDSGCRSTATDTGQISAIRLVVVPLPRMMRDQQTVDPSCAHGRPDRAIAPLAFVAAEARRRRSLL